MISRTKKKIDFKLQEIKEKNPECETIGIECDFSKITTMQEYRDLVENSELKDLDIGILCLNAGLGLKGPIDLVSDKKY